MKFDFRPRKKDLLANLPPNARIWPVGRSEYLITQEMTDEQWDAWKRNYKEMTGFDWEYD